jgi:hypothetical protein
VFSFDVILQPSREVSDDVVALSSSSLDAGER